MCKVSSVSAVLLPCFPTRKFVTEFGINKCFKFFSHNFLYRNKDYFLLIYHKIYDSWVWKTKTVGKLFIFHSMVSYPGFESRQHTEWHYKNI